MTTYIVNRDTFHRKYDDKTEAINEAKRISEENNGEEFLVLEVIGTARAENPQVSFKEVGIKP